MIGMKAFLVLGMAILAVSDVKAEGLMLETLEISSIGEIYSADKLRDPFMALDVRNYREAKPSVDSVTVGNLELKGLLVSSTTKLVMLQDYSTGVSYLLKKGKLWDASGKPIKGLSGSIKDNKTVLLKNENNDVFTLSLGAGLPRDPFASAAIAKP